MPSYSHNIIKISRGKEILQSILTEGELDFNKIIEMPEGLEGTISSTINDEGVNYLLNNTHKNSKKYKRYLELFKPFKNYFRHNRKNTPLNKEQLIEAGERTFDLIEKFGYPDWYSWRIHHWGTKWNAETFKIKGNKASFATAWDPPIPVLKELSKQYPKNKIKLKYGLESEHYETYYTVIFKKGKIYLKGKKYEVSHKF